jgi:hypothetical protein
MTPRTRSARTVSTLLGSERRRRSDGRGNALSGGTA